MNIRFLTPTLHGIVDYLAAAGLLTLPFILGLGSSSPLARWLAVGSGVAVVVVSMVTDYRYGAFHILPFRVHLMIDTLVAIFFAFAPSIFGFHGLDAWFYWANSAAVFLVVAVTQTKETTPTMAHA